MGPDRRLVPTISNPTDPVTDRWLRRQPPGQELARRYAVLGRFDAAKGSAAFNTRVDDLFATIEPDEDEYAIQRQARQIGAAMAEQLDARRSPTDSETPLRCKAMGRRRICRG